MQDIMLRGGATQIWQFAALVADRRGDSLGELVRPAARDDPCLTQRARQATVDEPECSPSG